MKRALLLILFPLFTSCSAYYSYEPEKAAKEFCKCFEKNISLGDKMAYDTCTKNIMKQYYYFRYAQDIMTHVIPYEESDPATGDSARIFYVRFQGYLKKTCDAYNMSK